MIKTKTKKSPSDADKYVHLQRVSDKLMNQHIICFTGPQVSKFFTTMLL